MERNLETYRSHISGMAGNTQGLFVSAYNRFPGIGELIDSDPDENGIYDAPQARINGPDVNPGTVKPYFSNIRQYLHCRGIRLHQLDVRQNLRFPTRYEEGLHPLGGDEFLLMLEACDHRHRIPCLAQSSSGMRIGEMVRLRKRRLNLGMERIMVGIPPAFTKRRWGRTAFLSREASGLLPRTLDGKRDSDLVFTGTEDPDVAVRTEVSYIGRLVKRMGLGGRYETNGRLKITTRPFRVFFITRVSRRDPNLAKLFAGQKGYLLQYDRLADGEKLARYVEFEPDLLARGQRRDRRQDEELKRRDVRIREPERANLDLLCRIESMRS